MNKPIHVGLATGNVFRLASAVLLLVLAGRVFDTHAQTLTNIHSFGGSPGNGNLPFSSLVQGRDGNFYGTASEGGNTNLNINGAGGNGTVFRISPSGTYTNLYSFGGSPTDGSTPYAGLVQLGDGNLYGTTAYGGTSTNCPTGCGTIFRISPSGVYTNLHSFVGSPTDGANPADRPVQGSDGFLYGTTYYGGTSMNCTSGCGTIFRISTSGGYTNLHSFVGPPADGASPYAELVQGSDGNLYGTTYAGGTSTNCGLPGCGTVFRISPSGGYANLYSFGGFPTDGAAPYAGLVLGSDGNFYGTTSDGGTSTNCPGTFGIPSGCGTVFRINPNGNETNLHSFTSHPDGSHPLASLVQGSDGNFYGTTQGGGTNIPFQGIVFRISPSGSETNLYSFAGFPNSGFDPFGRMVQASDGNFYGTTIYGGINKSGTVFRFSAPLNPAPYPINQITGVQLSGTNLVFNIPSIAYETYQLQFSSSMNPTNWVNVPGVSVTNSIGALLTLTNLGGALQPQGFYRFDITP
ncbi:MAG TPA: choice-of-anchor tandem repeat GloVer-containing protein [Verrucomicrobiae bacterium]|nr:choice-of-anchor tandem repeat GloVer-containing protein [Verrucomicrobiae bacterium]